MGKNNNRNNNSSAPSYSLCGPMSGGGSYRLPREDNRETEEILADTSLMNGIKRSEADIAHGRTFTSDEVWAKLGL